MAFGMELRYPTYPNLRTDRLRSIYPLGTAFYGGYRSSNGGVARTLQHPLSAPTGAKVESIWHEVIEIAAQVRCTPNETQTYIYMDNVYKRYGGYLTTFADCTQLASTVNFGIQFGDSGMNTVIAHPPTAPMKVLSRQEFTIPAGTAGLSTYINLPILNKNLIGYNDWVIFAGFEGRDYTPLCEFQPISSDNFNTGARIRVRVLNGAWAHGTWLNNGLLWSGSTPELKLYILIAQIASDTNTGYGFAMYNNAGNVGMSQDNVPVFAKGIHYHHAYPKSGFIPWQPAEQIPLSLQSSKLIMVPIGMSHKPQLSYVRRTHQWTGDVVMNFNGNSVNTCFMHRWDGTVAWSTDPRAYRAYSGYYFSASADYLFRENPVMLLDGEDYFILP